MKKITGILMLVNCLTFSTIFAQKKAAVTSTKTTKQVNPLYAFVAGTWKVTSVDGQLFVKMKPDANEISVPMGLWVGKNFIFSKDNLLTIKDAKKTYFSGTYVLNNNRITIPKFSGKFDMVIQKNGNNLQLSQTPDTFYSLLTQQSNQSLEQVKKMFRIPKNIIFNLSK